MLFFFGPTGTCPCQTPINNIGAVEISDSLETGVMADDSGDSGPRRRAGSTLNAVAVAEALSLNKSGARSNGSVRSGTDGGGDGGLAVGSGAFAGEGEDDDHFNGISRRSVDSSIPSCCFGRVTSDESPRLFAAFLIGQVGICWDDAAADDVPALGMMDRVVASRGPHRQDWCGSLVVDRRWPTQQPRKRKTPSFLFHYCPFWRAGGCIVGSLLL